MSLHCYDFTMPCQARGCCFHGMESFELCYIGLRPQRLGACMRVAAVRLFPDMMLMCEQEEDLAAMTTQLAPKAEIAAA